MNFSKEQKILFLLFVLVVIYFAQSKKVDMFATIQSADYLKNTNSKYVLYENSTFKISTVNQQSSNCVRGKYSYNYLQTSSNPAQVFYVTKDNTNKVLFTTKNTGSGNNPSDITVNNVKYYLLNINTTTYTNVWYYNLSFTMEGTKYYLNISTTGTTITPTGNTPTSFKLDSY